MALTFVHCQSCGGKTQLHPRLPGEEQTCMLCGQPSGAAEPGEDFTIPSTEEAGEKSAPHVPSLARACTCPHCSSPVVIDPARELDQQRCQACGGKLRKKLWNRKGRNPGSPEAETDLFRPVRDGVGLPVAGITLVVVLAATWILWLMQRPDTKKAATVETAAPAEAEQMRGLVARFAGAQSAEDVLPLVRDAERNAPSVKKWFAAHPGALAPGGGFARIASRRVALGTNLCQVAVSGRDEPLLLAETKDGWRVEWRAFAGEGDLSVAEFLEKHPAEPVLILAVVQRSTYYNEPYASSNIWQSLHLTGKKGDQGFYAYAPRNDPSIMARLKGLPDSPRDGRNLIQTSRRLALRLHFTSPEAEKLGLAEIVSVEGDGWFIP